MERENNENEPMLVICPKGHKIIITYIEWEMGYRCPGCTLNRAVKDDEVWCWKYCNRCEKVEPCTLNKVPDELLKAFDENLQGI